MEGCAKPTRAGPTPAWSWCRSGTVIHSDITPNSESFTPLPTPVCSRSKSASTMASDADTPVAMSHTETPTRPCSPAGPDTETSPDSACTKRSYAFMWA